MEDNQNPITNSTSEDCDEVESTEEELPSENYKEFVDFQYNGFSLKIGSCSLRADQLLMLCIQTQETLSNKKPGEKTGGYLG